MKTEITKYQKVIFSSKKYQTFLGISEFYFSSNFKLQETVTGQNWWLQNLSNNKTFPRMYQVILTAYFDIFTPSKDKNLTLRFFQNFDWSYRLQKCLLSQIEGKGLRVWPIVSFCIWGGTPRLEAVRVRVQLLLPPSRPTLLTRFKVVPHNDTSVSSFYVIAIFSKKR